MTKDELIAMLRTSHRQLERYLFYFEKNAQGVFEAGSRTKFGAAEMSLPGVAGDWSLYNLLANLTAWERRFYAWQRGGGEAANLPALPDPAQVPPGPDRYPIPANLRAAGGAELLAAFWESYRQVLALVASLPEAELFTPGVFPWTGAAALVDYLLLCTVRQYDWTKQQVRAWRKAHAGEYLNKEVMLARIQTERSRLEANLARLLPEGWETPGVVGEWTVKDLLAHLVAWEQLFLGWYQAGLQGTIPEVPAAGFTWQEIDRLNHQLYLQHRHQPLDQVQAAFQASFAQVLATLQAMPEEEIFTQGRYAWLGSGNLLVYILANTGNHYRWAKERLRAWLKSP